MWDDVLRLFVGDPQYLALVGMEFHLLGLLPFGKEVEVMLRGHDITLAVYGLVDYGVISKQANGGLQLFHHVIDEEAEYTGSQNWALWGLGCLLGLGLTAPHKKQPPGYNLLASFGSSCSFYLWHLRPTLSKALLKSMAITSVWWPAYMFSGKALTNSKSCVSQDRLHLNPCSRECCRLRLLGATNNFRPNARDPPRTRLNTTTSQFSLPSTGDPCIINKKWTRRVRMQTQ